MTNIMATNIELQSSPADSRNQTPELDSALPEIEQNQQTFEAYPEGGFRAYSVCEYQILALIVPLRTIIRQG